MCECMTRAGIAICADCAACDSFTGLRHFGFDEAADLLNYALIIPSRSILHLLLSPPAAARL